MTWSFRTENKIRSSDGQGHVEFLYLVFKSENERCCSEREIQVVKLCSTLYSSLVENTILMSVDKVIPQKESGVVSEQGKF